MARSGHWVVAHRSCHHVTNHVCEDGYSCASLQGSRLPPIKEAVEMPAARFFDLLIS